MEKKTTVTITATDGTQNTHSGDAVIVFTINWAEDGPTVSGKSIYIGENIPCMVVSDVLTNGIVDIFTQMADGHLPIAGSHLYMFTEKLKERCDEIRKNTTEEDFKDSLSYLVGKLLTV